MSGDQSFPYSGRFEFVFEFLDLVAKLGGLFVHFFGDRLTEIVFEFDDLKLFAAVFGGTLGDAANVLGLTVNIFEQGDQLLLERDVIVGTAESSLAAEFLERDAAIGTDELVDFLEFGLDLLFDDVVFIVFGGSIGKSRLRIGQILLGTLFAQVQFVGDVLNDFRHMERGGVAAPVALHRGGLAVDVFRLLFESLGKRMMSGDHTLVRISGFKFNPGFGLNSTVRIKFHRIRNHRKPRNRPQVEPEGEFVGHSSRVGGGVKVPPANPIGPKVLLIL